MSRYRIAFVVDQVAGHVTNAANLRRVVERDDEIEATWVNVDYWDERGALERIHARVPRVPQHPLGVARGILQQRAGLASGAFDAILTNTSVAQYQVRPLRRTPTVFDFDSTPIQLAALEGYEIEATGRTSTDVKYRLMHRLFHAVEMNQAWSNWARDSVISDYGVAPDRVMVNPPGIDLETWSPEGRRPGSASGPARVLFVGGDFRRKGGDDLLAWHRTVDPERVHLDIVTRESVDAAPGVHVHHGLRPNSAELLGLYRTADVFVLPSHGECFGIATIEAMASGIPVVVTDVGGTADIVEPGGNGHIVPAGSPERLGAAISEILDDPAAAARMGARSRALAEERFDLVANARVTLDMLKALADRHGATSR